MCAQDVHICSVFVLQAKGPIRAPFCQRAAVCLCAEQATGPFSLCVHNSLSVHTQTHTQLLSSSCQFLSLFLSLFFACFCCYLFFFTNMLCLSFFFSFCGPEALCKATRKKNCQPCLSVPLCFSIHFRSFPFFSLTCSHSCDCFRSTETRFSWLQEVKDKVL